LEEFNNIDRKPVALHNRIDATNVETSNEHFVCLMCYNNQEIKNRPTCVGCRTAIFQSLAKICNYDTDRHMIATPFVSSHVSVIPPTPHLLQTLGLDDNKDPELGHTDGVWSVVVIGDRIISGSEDRTIKIWNIPQQQP
jgi:WD40 repeat protein